MRSRGLSPYQAAMILVAAAGAAGTFPKVEPMRSFAEDPERIRRRLEMDAKAREIADWNAEVDRRKAEKKRRRATTQDE